jgi:D-methionine transport system substrate-binding protein
MKKSIKKSLALVLALAVLTAIALTGCGNSKSSKIQIAVPNDTTNEARALLLLQENGVIKLRDGAGITATKNDVFFLYMVIFGVRMINAVRILLCCYVIA